MLQIRRFFIGALAGILCLGAAGCSSNLKGYSEVKKAQEGIGALQSGRIILTTSYENGKKSGRMTTEFLFRLNEDDSISYCQTQFDGDNKSIYCEYGNGAQVEKWLIGKGWSDPEAQLCNRENPHRYLRLLSTPVEKASITEMASEPDGENTRYTMALNPEWLNANTYTDGTAEAVSETLAVTIDSQGQLTAWHDEAVMLDIATQTECRYRLDMEITDPNTVGEIVKPELRNNFQLASE